MPTRAMPERSVSGQGAPQGAGRSRRIIVLGSTGSIGTQALQVIRHLNTLDAGCRYELVGLAAGGRADAALSQAAEFGVRDVAVARRIGEGSAAGAGGAGVRLRTGEGAAESLVREVDCDLVLAAMVGVAGLPATLAAVELGRDVALANKETLVAAGALVIPAAVASGARLLPVDSEHSGVWQVLGSSFGAPPFRTGPEVARVMLTASGGPFRTWSRERMESASPEEALRHPTWSMGPKVTIDSASLMNKALELIEAHWLFGLGAERLSAIVHPQSVVHSLVEYVDGSVVAQLGAPDMRGPIQHALTYPGRAAASAARLGIAEMSRLEFEPPDPLRFPALGLAERVLREGGVSGAVLNAANEEAVRAFLEGRTLAGGKRATFGWISRVVQEAMDAVPAGSAGSLAEVLEADALARELVRSAIA